MIDFGANNIIFDGGSGNNVLETLNPSGTLYGGNGNDTLLAFSSGSSEFLSSGAGNDCERGMAVPPVGEEEPIEACSRT